MLFSQPICHVYTLSGIDQRCQNATDMLQFILFLKTPFLEQRIFSSGHYNLPFFSILDDPDTKDSYYSKEQYCGKSRIRLREMSK